MKNPMPFETLKQMRVSEKSTMLNQQYNQYALEVHRKATKSQIKVAMKNLFNVDVQSVRVINSSGKRLKNRWGVGRRNHIRKAYVRLMPGQHIDMGDTGS